MPVYKDKKTNKYYVKASYTDPYGDRKHITKRGFSLKKDAAKYEREIMQQVEEKGELEEGLSFSELADSYLTWYKTRRKASSYLAAHNHIETHLKPYFKKRDVHQLTPLDISKFHELKMSEGYAASYLKKMHVFLSAILRHGQKFYNVKTNVASLTGNFEMQKTKRVDFWQPAEFKRFIDVIDDITHRTFFILLFYTGMRKGELRALRWEDYKKESSTISITKTDYNGIVTTPKTEAAVREVLLPRIAVEALDAYHEYYKKHKHYKENYVMFGEFYKSVSDSTIDRWHERYFKMSGNTQRIRIHDFRHSHASHLIELGAPPLVIAQRLGHSDASLVLNTYGHLYPSTQQSIIDLIDGGGQSAVKARSEK